ncbi:mycofactocin biosynthesis glycosyltransferase MftF [Arthrobacter pascens]|uniref:mycofactocin biosynthesis glycosyltransferase MftF n=1 Tax=Arthrobacter pascens TaxID=1677 RepID=UPI00196BB228|nr:mycofactocin biosynthesis glycosyltransferase MftF [Arthrobacter pascens]MBN3496629.1 mycofactocin biosynthesis glycosyltransferase MftF [Arthrobacter pascens]
MTSQPELVTGTTVRLNRRVKISGGGRELIGGSPTRVLYLSEAASRMIVNRTVSVTDAGTGLLADRLLEAGMADPVLTSLPDLDLSTVTVVVPVYGRPLALDRLLTSIGSRHRVIVVDDCSPEPEPIKAVAEKHNAQLLRLAVNGGPARARNEGLRHVATPYVAFADSDVVTDTNTIALLLKHFNDPHVALAGPRVLGLDDGGGMNWIERYEEARSSLDLGIYPATVRPRSPVSWLPGAFLLARTDAMGEGFASGSRVGEDVDLVWRLVEQGWRVRFEPEAKVWHEHRQSVVDWLSRKAFYGTSAHVLALRHSEAIAPAVFAPWSVAVVAAILFQRPWSVPAAGAVTALAGWRISRKLSRSKHPVRVGAGLTARGLMAAQTQTMALLVRHWWPLAVTASIFSRRLRRALLISCLVDALWEYRRTRPQLDPFRFALARRLDDIAYGSGVWYSALKGRSLRCLLPDVRRNPK